MEKMPRSTFLLVQEGCEKFAAGAKVPVSGEQPRSAVL